MSNSSAFWFANPSTGFYPFTIGQSLRFAGSPNLARTPGSAGNRRTFTISFWFKRGNLGSFQELVSAYDNSSADNSSWFGIAVRADDSFTVNGWNNNWRITNRLFRDTASWYHAVVVVNSTLSTANDRIKIYINGIQETSFSNTVNEDQNHDYGWNNNIEHRIGSVNYSTNYYYLDGYVAEVNNIDGTAVGSTSRTNARTGTTEYVIDEFGQFKNDVWIPKGYTGSYGTNGFRLTFADPTDIGNNANSTDGTNDFTTVTNINDYDVVPDSPTNNFVTYNNVDLRNNAGLSEGNTQLDATTYSGGNFGMCPLTIPVPSSGKWYIECHVESSGSSGGNLTSFGVVDRDDMSVSATASNYYNTTGLGFTGQVNQMYLTSTLNYFYGVSDGAMVNSYVDRSFTSQEAITALAIDVDNGYIYIGRDAGVGNTGSQITWRNPTNGTTGTSNVNPESGSSGTGGIARTFNNNTVIVVDVTVDGGNVYKMRCTINAGQDSSFAGKVTAQSETDENGQGNFYYSVPSGYLALCSANLPDTTISPNQNTQASDLFNVTQYEGNASTRDIVVGFKPDWLWFKNLDNTYDHVSYDSVRGAGKRLEISDTETEADVPTAVTDFTATGGGFSLGAAPAPNQDEKTIVNFAWKAGGDTADVSGNFIKDGVAFTPTQGTMDANKMTVNTTSGFAIVQFTSNVTSDVGETGTPTTVAHGLGVKPSWVIIKDRDGGSYPHWNVWHPGYQPDQTYLNYQLFLQINNASNNAGWTRTDTGFTTNLFSTPRYQYTENGKSYIAYVFAEVEGFSKFGAYKGNGSTVSSGGDGVFVYTGFLPRWVMFKRADSADNWAIFDTVRDADNPLENYIYADTTATQTTFSTAKVDFLSNGFKWKGEVNFGNNASGTYVYMAFADQPFKFSNAR